MPKKEIKAHKFDRDENDHYVEPHWPTQRLLQVEQFEGPILDPACGWGRVGQCAQAQGFDFVGSDVVNRCDVGVHPFEFRELDFLKIYDEATYEWWRQARSIIGNPPFDLFEEFVGRALSLMFDHRAGGDKVAFIWLTRRLNAAHWLRSMPLARVYYMTPRPSMPTGEFIRAVERGERDPKTGELLKIGGGTQDFAWLVFEKGYIGKPHIDWLHRDEGTAHDTARPTPISRNDAIVGSEADRGHAIVPE